MVNHGTQSINNPSRLASRHEALQGLNFRQYVGESPTRQIQT